MPVATALIADDEPLLRQRLVAQLARLWPDLQIVAQARNGNEAVDLFARCQPQIAFLDVQMPGLSGIEAARCMGGGPCWSLSRPLSNMRWKPFSG